MYHPLYFSLQKIFPGIDPEAAGFGSGFSGGFPGGGCGNAGGNTFHFSSQGGFDPHKMVNILYFFLCSNILILLIFLLPKIFF